VAMLQNGMMGDEVNSTFPLPLPWWGGYLRVFLFPLLADHAICRFGIYGHGVGEHPLSDCIPKISNKDSVRLALAAVVQAIKDASASGLDKKLDAENWLYTTGLTWMELAGIYVTHGHMKKTLSSLGGWSEYVRGRSSGAKSKIVEFLETLESEPPESLQEGILADKVNERDYETK
jgi:hypothetical protein